MIVNYQTQPRAINTQSDGFVEGGFPIFFEEGGAALIETKAFFPNVSDLSTKVIAVYCVNGELVFSAPSNQEMVITAYIEKALHHLAGFPAGPINEQLFYATIDAYGGSTIVLAWIPPTVEDYFATHIFWDEGDAGLAEADFVEYTVISDSTTIRCNVTPGTEGTFRFYLKFEDVYGNIGPDSGFDVASVALGTPLELSGNFSYANIGYDLFASFTPDTEMYCVYIFINQTMLDASLIKYQNLTYMHNGPLPLGLVRLAAIAFNKFGIRSNIITEERIVYLLGNTVLSIPGFATPTGFRAITKANGMVEISFDDLLPGWDELELEIYNGDELIDITSIFDTISPAIIDFFHITSADGLYSVRTRAYQSDAEVYGGWSESFPAVVDSTFPAGSTAITTEVI